MMDRNAYSEIRAQLDMRPRLLPTAAIVVLDVLLLLCVARALRAGGFFLFVLAQLILVVVFVHNFSILHECGHGSASRHRWLNTLLGHYASLFCFIPFYQWKYIHQKHHAWTGNIDRDPVLKSLRTWRRTGVPMLVRVSWRSWVPLGALLQHVVYWTYPIAMWRAGEMTRVRLFRTLISILFVPIGYIGLHTLAPDIVRPSNVVLAFGLYLIAEELVNIPHHVDVSTFHTKLPIWEQYQATRSCYYPPGVAELLVLNFNFHIEHHLYPALPWYRLRRARTLVKARLGSDYHQAVGIAWNVEHRKRDMQSIVDNYQVQ